MPISVTGIWTRLSPLRRRRGGFSLIELLVVAVIITVFAGAAVLSLGVLGNDREIEREVFRLRTLLELLREEAVMQNRDYGVLFSETGYRFYIYDLERLLWFEPIDDRFLSARLLQEPLSLGLRLEDRDITLELEFEPEALERVTKGLAETDGIKVAAYIHPTRLALSGVTKGPGLYVLAGLVGQRQCVERLKRVADAIEQDRVSIRAEAKEGESK